MGQWYASDFDGETVDELIEYLNKAKQKGFNKIDLDIEFDSPKLCAYREPSEDEQTEMRDLAESVINGIMSQTISIIREDFSKTKA